MTYGSGMATLEQAELAKAALMTVVVPDKEHPPSWLRGIGVTAAHGGHAVLVNVGEMTGEAAALPAEVDGVPVVVTVVGDIVAQED